MSSAAHQRPAATGSTGTTIVLSRVAHDDWPVQTRSARAVVCRENRHTHCDSRSNRRVRRQSGAAGRLERHSATHGVRHHGAGAVGSYSERVAVYATRSCRSRRVWIRVVSRVLSRSQDIACRISESVRTDQPENAAKPIQRLDHGGEERGVAAVARKNLADRDLESADHFFRLLTFLVGHIPSPSKL